MFKNGVILCECNGAVERKLSLQTVARFLKHLDPELEVVIGNNLCKPHMLDRLIKTSEIYPSAIGACSDIDREIHFWKDFNSVEFNPCFSKIVDLLHEIESDFSPAELEDRVNLLVWSQVLKALNCKGILSDNIQTKFSISGKDVSRRDLASAFIPKYRIVPCVSLIDCAGSDKCKLCKAACPVGAIDDSDGTTKIDNSSCTGCGACVAVCPHEAVSYPGYSTEELQAEISGLLCGNAGLSPRILAFRCSTCADFGRETLPNVSPHILFINVPSLALASPQLLLHALNCGADGILLVHGEQCSSGVSDILWNSNIDFARSLCSLWGIDQSRFGCIEYHDDIEEFTGRLTGLVEELKKLGPTSLRNIENAPHSTDRHDLASLILEINDKLQGTRAGTLADRCVPFGRVKLDSDNCSGCGICVHCCPTDALSIKSSNDYTDFELIFRHDRCVACGMCSNLCPEKCIEICNALDIGKLDNSQEVLLRDDYACCSVCGKPYAPKSMIAIIRSKLTKYGNAGSESVGICPLCRVSVQQKI